MTNEIATAPQDAGPTAFDTHSSTQMATPADLLRLAVSQGADLDRLEKLMALQERWEREQARKAFNNAVADFKRVAPVIVKNKSVSYGVGKANYKHASLDQVTTKLAPVMAGHGLSHSWDVQQTDKMVTVVCRLAHRAGHSESVSMNAPPDNSGSKNSIQAISSTVTYLCRYTLLAVTGLATGIDDDDGAASEGVLNKEQVEKIYELLQKTGADPKRFLAYVGADSVETIPEPSFEKAMEALEKKARQAEGGQ